MAKECEELKKIWLKFLEIPQPYIEEREDLLDIFLMRFIYLKIIGEESEYEEFGDWSMVGSLLVHHFMSDIHQICQSIQKDSESSTKKDCFSDNDADIVNRLHQYMLKGRGWKFLFFLNTIGLQGVTCTKELINLITSMFPVCLEIQTDSLNSDDLLIRQKEFVNIEDLFFLKKIKSAKIHYVYKKNIMKYQRHRRHKTKIIKINHLHSNFSHNNNSASNSDEELEKSFSPTFENINYSIFLNNSEYLINTEKNTNVFDPMSFDQFFEFSHSVSLPDFCIYMIEVLLQIALLEKRNTLSNSSQQILNFSLEFLKSLELQQFQLRTWSCIDVINLERAILRLIAVTSTIEIEKNSSVCNLKDFHILMSVVKIVTKINMKEDKVKINNSNILLALEIIMTVLLWFLKLTEIPKNNENLIMIIQEIRILSDNEDLLLISNLLSCIESYHKRPICDAAYKIIRIIKDIIISLKRLRFPYHLKLYKSLLHSSDFEYVDHHVDIIESECIHNDIKKSVFCSVSAMCSILLDVQASSKCDDINIKIIEALQKCGLCCCLNFNIIINSLLKVLPKSTQIIQIYIITFIEKTLLKQFGLTVFNQNIICDICSNRKLYIDDDDDDTHEDKCSGNINNFKIKKGSFFMYYYYLIEDIYLTQIIGNTLLNMVIIGHEKLKKELFNQVIFPAFLDCVKVNETCIKNDTALEYCVVALSSLLQSSKIKELFLISKGLKCLYPLFNYSSIQNVALQTLKCLILSHWEKCNELNSLDCLQVYSNDTIEGALLIFEKLLFENTNQMCLLYFSYELNNEDFKSNKNGNETFYLKNQISSLESNSNFTFLCNLWSTCKDFVCRIPYYKNHLIKSSKMNIILDFLEIIFKIFNICNETTGNIKKTISTLFHTVLVICIDLISCENTPTLTNDKFYSILDKTLKEYFPENILNLQLIFETLFQGLIHTCSKERIFEKLNYEKFLHYEQEYQLPSESSEEIDITDEGYDGDVEIGENSSKNMFLSHCKSSVICNQEICKIILKFFEFHNKIYDRNNETWLSLLLYFVQQFINLCLTEFQNRIILHNEGIIKIIFINLENILISSLIKYKEKEILSSKSSALSSNSVSVSYTSINSSPVQSQSRITCINHVYTDMINANHSGLQKLMDVYHLHQPCLYRHGLCKLMQVSVDSFLDKLQICITELFFLIGQYSITIEELQLFFNFFKIPSSPMDIFLNGLNRLIKSLPEAPSEYITFPTKYESNESQNCSNDCLNTIEIDNIQMLENRFFFLRNNIEIELCSWKSAAAVLPLSDDSMWHPLQNGFSISLWLSFGSPLVFKEYVPDIFTWKTERNIFVETLSSDETECQVNKDSILHVFSIGTELMFEMWIIPVYGDLNFRITKCTSDGNYNCLTEMFCHKFVQPHKWQHIAINYNQIAKKEMFVADITVTIDGYRERKFFLHYCIQSEKFQNTYLLLGQNAKEFCNSNYYMGNLMLFQDNVLTREHSYYLSQLGPDIRNVTDCQIENHHKFFPHCLVPLMLDSGISVEVLTCMKIPSLVILQEKLLATYSPKNPNILNIYPNVFNTVISLLASFTGIPTAFKVIADDQKPSQQQPTDKIVKMNARSVCRMENLQHSIEAVGGIGSILFLFGRVVECSSNEKSQAVALELLFSLLQKNAKNYTTFQEINGMMLVKQILESKRCITSYLMLKVFLNACTNGSILQIDSSTGTALVDSNSKSIIVNPLIFKEMILLWKIWEKIEIEVLKTLFSVLQTLIRDKHPYQKYNISQMLSVSTVDVLFNILQDKFGNNECAYLTKEIAVAIPWLIQKLFSTFKLPIFQKIFNCILLLHQASYTYICHAPCSFYFLLLHDEIDKKNLIEKSEVNYCVYDKINEDNSQMELSKLFNGQINNLKDDTLSESNKLEINCEENIFNNEMQDIKTETFSNEFSLDENLSELMKEHLKMQNDKISSYFPSSNEETFLSEEDWEIISLYNSDSKEQRFPNIFIDDESSVNDESSVPELTLRDDVICRLINILRETIITAPDFLIKDVIEIIKPEALIVFALNPCSTVASSCIMTLDAYLQRSSDEIIENFFKIKGFHLLANQLHQFPASTELLNACLTFIIGHPSRLEEKATNYGFPLELNSVQMMACIPMLALLPNTAHNLALCHSTLARLQQLLIQIPNGNKTLLENGLMESLAKLILKIAHSNFIQDRNLKKDLIYDDIYKIIHILVTEIMSLSGSNNFQKLMDMLWLLSSLESHYYYLCSSCTCSEIYRNCQCLIFCAVFEHIIVYAYGYKKEPFISNKDIIHSDSVLDLLLSLPEMMNPYSHQRFFHDESSTNTFQVNLNDSHLKYMKTGKTLLHKIDNDKSKKVTFNELVDRFHQILAKAIDFLVYRNIGSSWLQKEKEFAQDLLHLTMQGVIVILARNKGSHRNIWYNIIHSVKEAVKIQFSRLFVFLLYPEQPADLKYFAVSSLNSEQKCQDIISCILQSSPQNSSRIAISVYDMLFNQLDNFDENKIEEIYLFANLLEKCKLKIPRQYEDEKLFEDIKKTLSEEYKEAYKKWFFSKQEFEKQIFHTHDSLMKQISENAMDATQIIVNAQNIERKKFMSQIKDSHTQKLMAQHKWSILVEQLTHERAVWHFKESYPLSWELDPTEGPLRVRRRLRRSHLNVEARFILPEFRKKLDSRQAIPPLNYLYETKCQANESTILKDKVHADEQICYNCCCYLVTSSMETSGEILIGEKCIYFVAENYLNQGRESDLLCQVWLIKDITEVLPRRYELQDSALELFLLNGLTYLIAFQSFMIREEFYAHIKKCPYFTPITVTSLSTLTNQWREYSITNFEYLMHLNKLAGRSFNDLMQYPIFPFIISNYYDTDLNLKDSNNFRNLSKPVAIQNKNREQHYINAYNYLKAEFEATPNVDSTLPISGPYHYGSHYSNSGTVLHFLVRLPPFTTVFLNYQDNNFDIPDRTFHSLNSSWKLSSGESTSDVKELIPEFFFLPEFLLNSEGFNFGIRQTGERVHHVMLPPWCHNDPRLFILIHRQALESDIVTGQLQNWIDLIFGYKQTGKAAVEAINVFHPVTYYGHDITKIEDPIKRCGLQTMIKTVGQTPKQLFFIPHPMVELTLSLGNEQPIVQAVLPNIQNLKWGSYVGSPAALEPLIIWRCNCSTPIHKLVPLLTNDVFGLTINTCLLLNHRKSKATGLVSNTYVMSTALVSWGHSDGIVRMTLQRDRPTIPLFKEHNDPISICESVPNCQLLFVGHLSGILDVYDLAFDSIRSTVEKIAFVHLYGHYGKIMAIFICKSYGIAVTCGIDCTMIIWDLNRLNYVQSIADHLKPVKLITVSDTLGDIASVSDSESGSYLKVHTINGKLVGTLYFPVPITAICYSNAKEGISVNVIATGFHDGTIKLWNSWNLNLASIIKADDLQCSTIISLTYSHDNQHLYAATKQGVVTMWKNPKKGIKESRFLTLK